MRFKDESFRTGIKAPIMPEMPWLTRQEAIRGYEVRIKSLEGQIKEFRDEINRLKGQRPIQEF